jgi:Nuclease-related domain
MIAKIFNIVLALLFAVLSSLTCLHGIAPPHFKVLIASLTLMFIMAELAVYYALSRIASGKLTLHDEKMHYHLESPLEWNDASLSELLSELPPEWIVLQNYYRKGIDTDFVVVGPTGVFIINVKNVRGQIQKYDSFLLLNNSRSINDFLQIVKDKANSFQRDFRSFGKTGNVIKPVLYFSQAQLRANSSGIHDDVLVTSSQSVITDITGNNHILKPVDVYGIYTVLSQNSVYSRLSTHDPFRGCFSIPSGETDRTQNEKTPPNSLELAGC